MAQAKNTSLKQEFSFYFTYGIIFHQHMQLLPVFQIGFLCVCDVHIWLIYLSRAYNKRSIKTADILKQQLGELGLARADLNIRDLA